MSSVGEAFSGRVLIAAFEGWSDAGGAASETLTWLRERLQLVELATIGAEEYVDFQMHRPRIARDETGERHVIWPDTKLFGPVVRPAEETPPLDDGDGMSLIRSLEGLEVSEIFVLHGFEPSREWQRYTQEVTQLCRVWEIDHLIMLGSLFADAPHTRPISVSLSSESAALRARFNCERSDYEGPIGISSVVGLGAHSAGMDQIACWASVPHYVHSAPSPKATLAMLDALEDLLDVVLPRAELVTQATEWEENISSLAAGDPDMTEYIERLEAARDEFEGPESTGEALAYEFEKFLRRDGDEPQGPSRD